MPGQTLPLCREARRPPRASLAGKHSLGMQAPLALQTQCLFVEDTFFFRAASIS